VLPPGGFAEVIKVGGPGIMGVGRNLYLLPSSPLAELRTLLPGAEIEFDPGMSPAESALMAARCDVAVVLAVKLDSEGFDDPDLSLPWGQDAVIEAVAAANPNTIVVLETRPDPPPGPPRSGHALGHPGHHRVHRRRRGRLPMVRPATPAAAVRLRARPVLHHLRVQQSPGRWR
jgi:hypothetical protein